MLKYLLPLIPSHKTYIELFAGGLALLLAKEPSEVEIINDFNGELISFYRVLKYHKNEFLKEIALVPNSREYFFQYMEQRGLTDIQKAARYFLLNKLSFGGGMRAFGVSVVHGMSGIEGRLKAISEVTQRLQRTTIENLDWKRCIELYDRPFSFFFADPPYSHCKQNTYDSWTDAKVQELHDVLMHLQGKWLCTINDCPVNRAIFSDCSIQAVQRQRGIHNKAGKSALYPELIVIPKEQNKTEHV